MRVGSVQTCFGIASGSCLPLGLVRAQVFSRPWACVALALCGLVFLAQPTVAQFTPAIDWKTLDQINAQEGTSVPPYTLNTPHSQIRLLGSLFSTADQSWSLTVDPMRGVAYVTENWPDQEGYPVGDIAAVNLRTLAVERRIAITNAGRLINPACTRFDYVGNRVFVYDYPSDQIYIADAASGMVNEIITPPPGWRFCPEYYSPQTQRLYGWRSDATGFAVMDLTKHPDDPGKFAAIAPGIDPNFCFFAVDESAKMFYHGLEDNRTIAAVDIDLASASYGQVVWSTETGSVTNPWPLGGCLQPAVDPVRHLLYIPDVGSWDDPDQQAGLHVFDIDRASATYQQQIQTIPLDGLPPARTPNPSPLDYTWSSGDFGSMLTPIVDPVTGMVYVLATNDTCVALSSGGAPEAAAYCNDDLYQASVLAVDRNVGVVGRSILPASQTSWSPPRLPGPTPSSYKVIVLDPATRQILVTNQADQMSVLQDLRSSAVSTPSSSNSPVTVTAPEATITFSSVSSGGETTIRPLPITELNVQFPGQFTINGAALYDVSTTANVAGPITLCFNLAYVNDPAEFDSLWVLHAENSQLVNRTVSRDFPSRTVCATTSSLSPFVVARLTTAAFTPRLLYTIDRSYRAGSTIPIKVQVIRWDGANASSPTLALRAVKLTRTADDVPQVVEDSGNANPDFAFRYDAGLQGYIFNLSTKGLAPGTYSLTAEVGSGGKLIHLPFGVR